MQDPFLLCLCHRGAFTGFLWIFLFAVPLSRKRKAVYDRLPMNGTSRPHGRQTGKNDFIRPTGHVRPDIQNHTSLPVVCPVSRLRQCPFSFWRFPFFTDFSFEVFLSNLPPLPFTSIFAPFSGPHQAVIFVLGAKVTPGLDGKARSSLLFSEKISSPAGSILAEKLSQVMIISLQ